ncbi:MAG: helix-turn-helix transcriptional regulator [Maribacter sp.]|nr:helix-turn-helix transcriptional regulator [Maribacter sp.]
MKTQLGPNLKFLRQMKGLSQTRLAESIGVKRNKIASYESGIVEPQFAVIIKLTEALDTNIKDLLLTKMDDNVLEVLDTPPDSRDTSKVYYAIRKEIEAFITSTLNGQKSIDGFSTLFEQLPKASESIDWQLDALHADRDQLVDMIKRLLAVNWQFIHSIQGQSDKDLV